MKFIVPIRANRTSRSIARYGRAQSSFASLRRRGGVNQGRSKRFLTVAVFGLLASGLVVGATGSIFTSTSAQSSSDSRSSSLWQYLFGGRDNPRQDRNDRNERNNRNERTEREEEGNAGATQNTQPPVEPTQNVAPVEQAPVEAPAPQPAQPVVVAPVQSEPEVVPPAPVVNTAPQIATMAAAQATPQSQQISYTSSRISDTTRNQILIVAATTAVVGGILYTLGMIGGATPTRRSIPVRYVVPIKESISVREG